MLGLLRYARNDWERVMQRPDYRESAPGMKNTGGMEGCGSLVFVLYTNPWKSIASATLTNPAILAPTTRFPGCPYSCAVP
jgi:hypothetical protein